MNYSKESNMPSTGEAVYDSRKEIRRRRELRKRKQRRKNNLFLLIFLVVVSVCAIFFASRQNNEETVREREEEQIVSGDTLTFAEKTASPEPEITPEKNDYSAFRYYEADKQERYEAYQAMNPSMDASEVVWKVNSNLDKEWYTADIPVDGYDDPYIIVNKYYKVPDGYRPPDLVEADGFLMRKDTADAYLRMRKDAESQGLRMRAVSAYRSVDYQRGLYNRYLAEDTQENVDRYSARAGYSEHHTGMAIDLFGSQEGLRNFVNTPEYIWVRDNGYKYGFIIRYQADIENITGYEDEPWHIRYVGPEVSTDMKNKGIASFEEYHVKYIEHN